MNSLPLITEWSTTLALAVVFALLLVLTTTLGEVVLTGTPEIDIFTLLFGVTSFLAFVGACRYNLWTAQNRLSD